MPPTGAMKPNKRTPVAVEVSPSQKKLKQARLPFKLITDAPSPVVEAPNTRKRKLSVSSIEVAPKIGKLCKENDVEDLVILSDEDSLDTPVINKEEKQCNPLVKMVNTAWKKKQQKSSKTKKPGHKNKGAKRVAEKTDDSANNDVEMVEAECVISVNGTISDSESQNDTSNTSEVKQIISGNDLNSECLNENKITTTVDEKKSATDSKPINEQEQAKTDAVILLDENSNDSTESDSELPIDNQKIEPEDDKSATNEHDLKREASTDAPMSPRRSVRSKVNQEKKEALDSSSSSSTKLNASILSSPSTPKSNKKNVSDSNNISSTPTTNLTPKQLQKKVESAKKREEREKEKLEREKKKQQEKEERDKVRKEKEDQKRKEREEKEEVKKKEREEKEEQRKKEKEEKERVKELEKKQREEKEEQRKKEKEEKEEQKRKEKEAREEERRKKQEALELEKQEQELKKKKAAEAFVNFFVAKQKNEKDSESLEPVSKNDMLSSFNVKADMRLAPIIRSKLTDERKKILDDTFFKSAADGLYLKDLKNGVSKPESSGKTWPMDDKEDDVIIVEDELPAIESAGEAITCESAVREKLRPKLFSFHENRRPPYWGTWRKKSACIKPRKPFGQDEKLLDYEVDSDDEWEEEQEGESIDGSVAGSDTEPADNDEYEVDNELFVPHGYLSDEEATVDEDDIMSLTPEAQKARLKHLEDEFASEMKKPTEKLKPRLYGLIWETNDGGKPDNCVEALWNYFGKLGMIMEDPTELLKPLPQPEEVDKKKSRKKKMATDDEKQSPKNEKKKSKQENKESKKAKIVNNKESKSIVSEKKTQLGINSFLSKLKSP